VPSPPSPRVAKKKSSTSSESGFVGSEKETTEDINDNDDNAQKCQEDSASPENAILFDRMNNNTGSSEDSSGSGSSSSDEGEVGSASRLNLKSRKDDDDNLDLNLSLDFDVGSGTGVKGSGRHLQQQQQQPQRDDAPSSLKGRPQSLTQSVRKSAGAGPGFLSGTLRPLTRTKGVVVDGGSEGEGVKRGGMRQRRQISKSIVIEDDEEDEEAVDSAAVAVGDSRDLERSKKRKSAESLVESSTASASPGKRLKKVGYERVESVKEKGKRKENVKARHVTTDVEGGSSLLHDVDDGASSSSSLSALSSSAPTMSSGNTNEPPDSTPVLSKLNSSHDLDTSRLIPLGQSKRQSGTLKKQITSKVHTPSDSPRKQVDTRPSSTTAASLFSKSGTGSISSGSKSVVTASKLSNGHGLGRTSSTSSSSSSMPAQPLTAASLASWIQTDKILALAPTNGGSALASNMLRDPTKFGLGQPRLVFDALCSVYEEQTTTQVPRTRTWGECVEEYRRRVEEDGEVGIVVRFMHISTSGVLPKEIPMREMVMLAYLWSLHSISNAVSLILFSLFFSDLILINAPFCRRRF
jgi:hypothetical protein